MGIGRASNLPNKANSVAAPTAPTSEILQNEPKARPPSPFHWRDGILRNEPKSLTRRSAGSTRSKIAKRTQRAVEAPSGLISKSKPTRPAPTSPPPLHRGGRISRNEPNSGRAGMEGGGGGKLFCETNPHSAKRTQGLPSQIVPDHVQRAPQEQADPCSRDRRAGH